MSKEILTDSVKRQLLMVIESHKDVEGSLISILHKAQEVLGYIPYEAQKFISEETGVPLSEIYGIVTFYSRFSLNPVGKHKVGVCLGTACYVKGSDKILKEIENDLNIKAGETSSDGLFSIEATRCIGACGLAPVMTVGEDVYGRLDPKEVHAILEKYKNI